MVFLHVTNKAYLDRIRTTYYIEEHTLLEEHTTESLLPNIKGNTGPIQRPVKNCLNSYKESSFKLKTYIVCKLYTSTGKPLKTATT